MGWSKPSAAIAPWITLTCLSVPEASMACLGRMAPARPPAIRMLATLLRPDGGSARIFGHDIVREAHIVRQLIGVTGQYASVDETLSATENLYLFSRLNGLSRKEAKAKSAALLEEFGLTDAAKRPLKQFSGGMRRRLDLAASLISQPPLIFLDEPTTGLDPRTRAQMWETIRRLVASGSTILLTTQYLDEADQLADRIAVIDRGHGRRGRDRRRVESHRRQLLAPARDRRSGAARAGAGDRGAGSPGRARRSRPRRDRSTPR